MPTLEQLRQETREITQAIREDVGVATKRARNMRKLGLINDFAMDQMIHDAANNAGRPKQCDPKEFPNAGRLKR